MITFNKLWEEEEAQEEKVGATEDQALSIQRISLKQWGIWRTQLLKNFLSIMNEEDDEAEGSRMSLPSKQIKISI